MSTNENPRYLTVNRMNEITGIDRRIIKKRLAGIAYEETKNGFIYDGHIAFKAIYEKASATTSDAKVEESKRLYEAARAEKAQLEVEKIKGNLVEVNQVSATVEKEYAYVRAQLLSIPSKLAKVLALIDDPAKVKETLDESVAEVLSELSKTDIYESELSVEASADTPEDSVSTDEAELS